MTERIKKAIDIFLDAINNGTLAKGTCIACAVGNLVADAINYKIDMSLTKNFDISKIPNAQWGKLFCTSYGEQEYLSMRENDIGVIANIQATDF